MTPSDRRAVLRVLAVGQLAQGHEVAAFEKGMANFFGVRRGVAVSSGTAALHLALLALGVREDDEVIIPSYVCPAVVNAVLYLRAAPVIVDSAAEGYSLSGAAVRRRLSKRTRTVIAPAMFGEPLDWKPFETLGVPVIEDCTQALGASSNGTFTGARGALAIVSFYATKYMTTGEGGMVLGSDAGVLDRVEDLRSYDERQDFRVRYNYKMSELQAALGRSQLAALRDMIRVRRALAACYAAELRDSGLTLPRASRGSEHAFYRFVVSTPLPADEVVAALHQRGIDARRPVFKPLHRYFQMPVKSFPYAERAFRHAVSLPLYPSLKRRDVRRIATALRAVCVRGGA